MTKFINGDCIEEMAKLEDSSVDLILTDPPYGTTACKWDSVIPFEPMWAQIKRIRKERAAVVLFGSEPFSSFLRCSNIKEFKYDWVWEKNRGSNFATVKYMPMKEHEMISVFFASRYYPIKDPRAPGGASRVKYDINASNTGKRQAYNGIIATKRAKASLNGFRCPRSVQKVNTEVGFHPTQKPVALLEYLIKTYTQPGETVLDFTMGSGSTGVACVNTGRSFIGIERDEGYFEIAKKRVNDTFDEVLFSDD